MIKPELQNFVPVDVEEKFVSEAKEEGSDQAANKDFSDMGEWGRGGGE